MSAAKVWSKAAQDYEALANKTEGVAKYIALGLSLQCLGYALMASLDVFDADEYAPDFE